MNSVVDKASALWDKEQIKILVMLSLMLQIVLIIVAPLRKRSCDKRLLILLWLAYLGVDYIATLALGSILANTFRNAGGDLPGQRLTAFWAPFLLLHLGGPDNITSYSIEDNELWWRHFLSFVVQVSVALVVLIQSKLKTSKLLVPSILIFIVGTVKFGERILALRAASMQQLKHSIYTSDQCQLFGNIAPDNDRGLLVMRQDAQLNGQVSDISDAKCIFHGYIYFLVFKPHLTGTSLNYTFEIRNLAMRKVIRDFKLIGMELSFFFDILRTKATVMHCIMCRVIRMGSLVSIMIALFIFHNCEKRGYESSDLIITYILLSVALFLDVYSSIHLVTSKWMTVSLLRLNKRWSINIAGFISRAKNHIFCRGTKGWWSGRMGQYSLIQSALKKQVFNCFVSERDCWCGSCYVALKKKSARDFFIFLVGDGEESTEVSDILEKIVMKHVGNNLFEPGISYGTDLNNLLRKIRSSWITSTLDRYHLTGIKDEMMEKTFDECVIAWHMATDILYFALNNALDDSEQGRMREAIYRLSNYMMYLLLERSSMMPPGIAKNRVGLTLEHSSFIFGDTRRDNKQARTFLYDEVMGVDELAECWRRRYVYEGSKSVVPLANLLVKHLKAVAQESEERLWEVICNAWMEMLTFAAVHCSTTEHARSVSRGGELLTHYWLLLAHYGVMDEYNAYQVFLKFKNSDATELSLFLNGN